MIINQIQKIGRAFYDEQEPYEILIRTQNPVKSDDENPPKLLTIKANIQEIEDISFKYRIIDYEAEKSKDYLLGLTSGRSTNYSLTLSTGWSKSGKNKKIKLNKIIKILKEKIDKKPIFELLEADFGNYTLKIKNLLEYIKENKKEIQEKLANFLEKQGYSSFQNPLIFKIIDEDGEKFLGEIPLMRRIYEYIYLGKTDKLDEDGKCSICGSSKGIREGFNFGLYTIDQASFQSAFFENTSDFSFQYLMCSNCYFYSLLGYVILKEDLTFYSYKIKEGRKSVPIYHYVIPLSKDLKSLKDDVETIKKAKQHYDEKAKKNFEDNLKQLRSSIEDINEKAKELTKKELNKLKTDYQERISKNEKQLESISNSFPIEEIVIELFSEEKAIPIMDLYFKITNQKLNPKTKQIMSQIIMNSSNIEKLADLFFKTKNNDILDINKVRLSGLKNLMDSRSFLHYYSSLLSLKKVYRKNFIKDTAVPLKKSFIAFRTENDEKKRRKLSYRSPLKSYELYNFLFSNGKLWRDYQ
jgi:hypothetical protein